MIDLSGLARDALPGLCLALAVLLAVPVTVLLVQVLAACLRAAAALPHHASATACAEIPSAGQRPRVAVLVPAHDEAAGIAATLAVLLPQLAPHDVLLVVADNCSDDTAGIAERAGATVLQRSDRLRRGKGYALDFGVRHLAAHPPDVVVVVDADCVVAAGGIEALARLAVTGPRPLQALYLMQPPLQAGLRLRIGAFAWIVRNRLRPLGGLRLGWPCQLMGSGMAFRWDTLAAAALASGNIVEDLQLGVDMALAGRAPLFAPQVEVHSRFPDGDAAASSQRTRWEHGQLATLLTQVPRLLGAALRHRDARLLGMALDLCVPPLALLTMLCVASVAAAAACAVWLGTGVPLLVALAVLVLLVGAVLLAWWQHGRSLLGGLDLLRVPLYALAKLPIYLRFLVRRQATWVRARRHGD